MGFKFDQIDQYERQGSGGDFSRIGKTTVDFGFFNMVKSELRKPDDEFTDFFYPIDYENDEEGAAAYREALSELRERYNITEDYKVPTPCFRFTTPIETILTGAPSGWQSDEIVEFVNSYKSTYEVERDGFVEEKNAYYDLTKPSVMEHLNEGDLGNPRWMRLGQQAGLPRPGNPDKRNWYTYIIEVYASREEAEAAAGTTLDSAPGSAEVRVDPPEGEWDDYGESWHGKSGWLNSIVDQIEEIVSKKNWSVPLNKVQASFILKALHGDEDGDEDGLYPNVPKDKVVEIYEEWHSLVESGSREVIPF